MKKKARVKQQRAHRNMLARRYAAAIVLALGASWAGAADEDPADSPVNFEGPEDAGSNWIELGAGGMYSSGNNAQAEQRRRVSENVFGGIEDLHFSKEIAKLTTLSLDGRGIYDENDYRFGLGLKKEETYYLKLDFEEFRTYSDADGGYYPPTATYYPYSSDALTLDRGKISFEAGLTLENLPALRFRYTHLYRDGEKGSTSWGPTHPGLINPTVGLVPSVQDIDETRDILELDATYKYKETDFNLGGFYEFGDLKNTRKMEQYPGEPAVGGVAQDRKITNQEKTSYDTYNVHLSSETWIKPNLFFSAGYMYSDLDNDTTGNRVWGDDFGLVFVPNDGNGQGYTNLLASARKQDHVLNANLMTRPMDTLTITPSIRAERQDWDANSSAASTFGSSAFAATASNSDADAIDVRERLDIVYSGLTNFVFNARGEWTQGQGNLSENGGIFNAATTPGTPIQRETEETRFFQKYSLGAKWYAARQFSIDLEGYYKLHQYDYDHTVDSTPNNSVANRYPAYLTVQDFETYDGNVRLTYRPFSKLTLVTRYEYQLSTVDTGPDPISGLGETESGKMSTHVFSQNVSWVPWSRLYLQAGIDYVDSKLQTPASDYTSAVLEAQNNYWSVNCNVGFVLDDKTDLNLGYSYYLADDYTDNSPAGVPYGSGAEEHGINATLIRRLTPNLRATLRYGYYTYTDDCYGGNRDFDAQVFYTSLQYRF